MKDLSSLAEDSMWVTSQEGGLMVHDNSKAFSAPGTEPVTPMPPADKQTDPKVTPSSTLPLNYPPGRISDSTTYTPAPAAWKKTVDGNG